MDISTSIWLAIRIEQFFFEIQYSYGILMLKATYI